MLEQAIRKVKRVTTIGVLNIDEKAINKRTYLSLASSLITIKQ
jgi:hypothetical protein